MIFSKVMLIDDNDIDLMINKRVLSRGGLSDDFIIMNNGLEAMSYLWKNVDDVAQLPDTILVDIQMPLMNGFEFLEEYMKLPEIVTSRIHLCMLSSSIDPTDFEKCNQMPIVKTYFIKPLRLDQLLEHIAKSA